MKKSKKKTFFLSRQFYTLYKQEFSNLKTLLCSTFPQGFQKYKIFGHLTLGSRGKKIVKRSEKHQYQKILLSKAKIVQKQALFVRQFNTLY